MAKVETIRLVDDISGDEADETVDFGLDGRLFEIDLTSAHADRLRAGLAPFVSAARPSDSPGARRSRGRAAAQPAAPAASPGTGSDAATREHNRAVRAWARENGFTVSERGRIPSEVVEAYRRGTPAPAAAGTPAPAGTARPEPQQATEQKPATQQPAAGEKAEGKAAEKPDEKADAKAEEKADEKADAKSDAKQAPTVQFSG